MHFNLVSIWASLQYELIQCLSKGTEDQLRHQAVRPATLVASGQVPADSAASGVDYFPYETVQLTSDVIDQLEKENISNAEIFSFPGSSTVTANASCKSLPGDASWPSPAQWDDLNDLLEDALIEGVPSASVCYPDWPQYDLAKCNEVTGNWTDSEWQ